MLNNDPAYDPDDTLLLQLSAFEVGLVTHGLIALAEMYKIDKELVSEIHFGNTGETFVSSDITNLANKIADAITVQKEIDD